MHGSKPKVFPCTQGNQVSDPVAGTMPQDPLQICTAKLLAEELMLSTQTTNNMLRLRPRTLASTLGLVLVPVPSWAVPEPLKQTELLLLQVPQGFVVP